MLFECDFFYFWFQIQSYFQKVQKEGEVCVLCKVNSINSLSLGRMKFCLSPEGTSHERRLLQDLLEYSSHSHSVCLSIPPAQADHLLLTQHSLTPHGTLCPAGSGLLPSHLQLARARSRVPWSDFPVILPPCWCSELRSQTAYLHGGHSLLHPMVE